MGESCKEVREFCRSNGQNEYSPRKLKFSRGGGGRCITGTWTSTIIVFISRKEKAQSAMPLTTKNDRYAWNMKRQD